MQSMQTCSIDALKFLDESIMVPAINVYNGVWYNREVGLKHIIGEKLYMRL